MDGLDNEGNLRSEPASQSAASYYASLFEETGLGIPRFEWADNATLDAEREYLEFRAR